MHIPVKSQGFWRMGTEICAFSDSERHLGHIVKFQSRWLACDGTHLGPSGIGFRIIGTFPDIESAKRAVEFASIRPQAPAKGSARAM
jgi:hypothetical protein